MCTPPCKKPQHVGDRKPKGQKRKSRSSIHDDLTIKQASTLQLEKQLAVLQKEFVSKLKMIWHYGAVMFKLKWQVLNADRDREMPVEIPMFLQETISLWQPYFTSHCIMQHGRKGDRTRKALAHYPSAFAHRPLDLTTTLATMHDFVVALDRERTGGEFHTVTKEVQNKIDYLLKCMGNRSLYSNVDWALYEVIESMLQTDVYQSQKSLGLSTLLSKIIRDGLPKRDEELPNHVRHFVSTWTSKLENEELLQRELFGKVHDLQQRMYAYKIRMQLQQELSNTRNGSGNENDAAAAAAASAATASASAASMAALASSSSSGAGGDGNGGGGGGGGGGGY